MLTRQLFSEVAQQQLLEIYGEQGDGSAPAPQTASSNTSIVPLRVPLIDLGRQLEAEPDTCLDADPVNDLLTIWIQRNYGQDSVRINLSPMYAMLA